VWGNGSGSPLQDDIRNRTEGNNELEDKTYFIALLNRNCDNGIVLVQIEGKNQYARADAHKLLTMNPEGLETDTKTICIRQSTQLSRKHSSSRMFAFHVTYGIKKTRFFGNTERKISVTSLGKSFEFDTGLDVSPAIYELSSLNSIDGLNKVLVFRLETNSGDWGGYDWGGVDQWDGAVIVVLKWNSQTGTYCSQALYTPDRTAHEYSQVVSHPECTKKSEFDFEKGCMCTEVQMPPMGRGTIYVTVTMYTKLDGDRAVVAIEIMESCTLLS
jgi:hypothetical protein